MNITYAEAVNHAREHLTELLSIAATLPPEQAIPRLRVEVNDLWLYLREVEENHQGQDTTG
jgi:hypothetical protein